MSTHSRENAPNMLTLVRTFMEIGGQTTSGFNATQATLYVGLLLEEVAEVVSAIADGDVTGDDRYELVYEANRISGLATDFKSGMHRGCVMRCDHEKLLDGMIDSAWVAIGGALSVSPNADGAVAEVGRANHDKFPGGVAQRDANGKVMKPMNWRGPNLQPFVVDKEQLK